MVYSYKCHGKFNYITTDGTKEAIKCPCGQTHELGETTFAHEPYSPNIVPDTLHDGMDWAAGRKFATRTERKQHYKEHGLQRISRKEQRRNMDCTGRKPLGPISYSGQKSHTSRV